ncbi:hypothetical protein EVG20_g1393 [Dentipellis fragilis]|uniref:F-box domain-containing protein n=1 Tax=Dentipellis fragilis TaxID=205917 RepID=A0A4Y9ZAY7_9AGAM|nr:hypothetical protein EVG20_g1393 [Dentipellis fragilis]
MCKAAYCGDPLRSSTFIYAAIVSNNSSYSSKLATGNRKRTTIPQDMGANDFTSIQPTESRTVLDFAPTRALQDASRLVARLPPELLNHIFWYVSEETRDLRVRGRYLDPLLNITHVCHLWREVALASAILWTSIDLVRPRLAQEYLERSKQFPITVVSRGDTLTLNEAREAILKLALQEASRLRDIVLQENPAHKPIMIPYQHVKRCISMLQASTAPNLRHLHISFDRLQWLIQGPLFEGDPSSLQILGLRNCPVDWSWLTRMTNLTQFTLEFNPGSSLNYGINDMLGALSRMSQLRELNIHILNIVSTVSTALADVALPGLEQLSLAITSKGCLPFIDSLLLPPRTNLHLCFPTPRLREDENIPGLKSTLLRHYTRHNDRTQPKPHFHGLYISGALDSRLVEFRAFNHGSDASHGSTKLSALHLTFDLPESTSIRDWLEWMLSELPFQDIDTVAVQGKPHSFKKEDFGFLHHSNVRANNIVLIGAALRLFSDAIDAPTKLSAIDGLPYHSFPPLHLPDLTRLDIVHANLKSPSRSRSTSAERLIHGLNRIKQERLAAGQTLPVEIHATECHIDRATALELNVEIHDRDLMMKTQQGQSPRPRRRAGSRRKA